MQEMSGSAVTNCEQFYKLQGEGCVWQGRGESNRGGCLGGSVRGWVGRAGRRVGMDRRRG